LTFCPGRQRMNQHLHPIQPASHRMPNRLASSPRTGLGSVACRPAKPQSVASGCLCRSAPGPAGAVGGCASGTGNDRTIRRSRTINGESRASFRPSLSTSCRCHWMSVATRNSTCARAPRSRGERGSLFGFGAGKYAPLRPRAGGLGGEPPKPVAAATKVSDHYLPRLADAARVVETAPDVPGSPAGGIGCNALPCRRACRSANGRAKVGDLDRCRGECGRRNRERRRRAGPQGAAPGDPRIREPKHPRAQASGNPSIREPMHPRAQASGNPCIREPMHPGTQGPGILGSEHPRVQGPLRQR